MTTATPILTDAVRAAIGDFRPSDAQARAIAWAAEGEGSALLVAVAGAGKTTTLVQMVAGYKAVHPEASVLVLVFARKNADEMAPKFARFASTVTGTFHSVCFRAYRRGRRVRVDNAKTWNVFDEVIEEHVDALRAAGDYRVARERRDQSIRRFAGAYGALVAGRSGLVGKAKAEGVGYLIADAESSWYDLAAKHDIVLDGANGQWTMDEAIDIASRVLRRGVEIDDVVDFDDMLYLPLVKDTSFYRNSLVLVDEAQDTNPVQRALLQRMVARGGRVVGVGDPHQGIFAFRGASADAMEALRREWNAVELPLTTSFRCPRAVVADAQRFVGHIEAHPEAPEGSVSEADVADLDLSDAFASDDAVICRNVAPLASLWYRLAAARVGARILGRDFGAGLTNLIKRLGRARDLDDLLERLDRWAEREIAKALAKRAESTVASIEDRAEALRAIAAGLGEDERTVSALVATIERMFDDRENGGLLTLATIHKAKGLEWDRVWVLRPDKMPSKWARTAEAQQQEVNLQYVAATRAKRDLVYLHDRDAVDREARAARGG